MECNPTSIARSILIQTFGKLILLSFVHTKQKFSIGHIWHSQQEKNSSLWAWISA